MRAYWILPNRDQGDETLASDGKTIVPLRDVLDPKRRPEGFSHGVPTEILEKCERGAFEEILFAQRFPDWNGKELLSVSTTAGVDSTGRVVHIGIVFMLEPRERPRFELSCSVLPDEDKGYARALLRRMTSAAEDDPWLRSVRDLIELPTDRPSTNVELDRSVVRFDSLYELGPHGLTKKPPRRRGLWTTTLIVLLAIAFSGAWSCVHSKSCSVAESDVENGAVSWRFN